MKLKLLTLATAFIGAMATGNIARAAVVSTTSSGPTSSATSVLIDFESGPFSGDFGTITGHDAGLQTGAPNFTFGGSSVKSVEFMFQSGSPANVQPTFEVDNIAINAVPEPATWTMIILGFLGLGFLGYRKSSRRSGTSFRVA
jgi:hypothetical protein